MQRNCNFVVKW